MVTLITGAGSGIGRACAVMLSQRKHQLVLVGRTENKLADAADEIRAIGSGDVMIARADISDADQAKSLIDQTIERFGRIDNLLNIAGVAPSVPIDKTTKDLFTEVFSTNIFGAGYLIAACWPHFRSQKGGCIVNVGTLGSSDPFPGFFVYAASKSALDSLTRSAEREGRALGVRAFSVNLGCVETPLLRSNFNEKMVPPHKTISPETVAATIADCIEGKRADDHGKIILMPSP